MTIYHLYTIAALIMAIMLLRRLLNGPPPPPQPTCAHFWELVDKTEFISPIEEYAKKANFTFKESHAGTWWLEMSRRKVVLVLRCSKCDSPPVIKEIVS